MKEWQICENEGCGKLLPTYGGMQNARSTIAEIMMKIHTNNNDGAINRRTMYGFGLPCEDMFTPKGKVMYGKIRKNGYVLCATLKKARMDGVKSFDM